MTGRIFSPIRVTRHFLCNSSRRGARREVAIEIKAAELALAYSASHLYELHSEADAERHRTAAAIGRYRSVVDGAEMPGADVDTARRLYSRVRMTLSPPNRAARAATHHTGGCPGSPQRQAGAGPVPFPARPSRPSSLRPRSPVRRRRWSCRSRCHRSYGHPPLGAAPVAAAPLGALISQLTGLITTARCWRPNRPRRRHRPDDPRPPPTTPTVTSVRWTKKMTRTRRTTDRGRLGGCRRRPRGARPC